jgi:hypothetical protein
MNHAHTNLDLIQPDPVEPNEHELAVRIAELIPALKARPPRMQHIFTGLPCLDADRDAFRDALRARRADDIGRMVLAYWDAYCEDEAGDLAYGLAVDDLTPRDLDVLADLGDERRFRA